MVRDSFRLPAPSLSGNQRSQLIFRNTLEYTISDLSKKLLHLILRVAGEARRPLCHRPACDLRLLDAANQETPVTYPFPPRALSRSSYDTIQSRAGSLRGRNDARYRQPS